VWTLSVDLPGDLEQRTLPGVPPVAGRDWKLTCMPSGIDLDACAGD
jgi:hypothetical protein